MTATCSYQVFGYHSLLYQWGNKNFDRCGNYASRDGAVQCWAEKWTFSGLGGRQEGIHFRKETEHQLKGCWHPGMESHE